MKTSSLFPIRYSLFAVATAAVATLAASSAIALDCAPYCDFTHDYGPYDLTWARPGLYAYPVCGPNGNCAPYAVHTYPRYRGVRITVRPRNRNR